MKNALDQTLREIHTRYDLKDTKTTIEATDTQLTINSDSEYTLGAVRDLLESKFIRRGLSLKILDYGKEEPASGARVRQVVALVGESGSGKSTTARLIARLIAPSSGEIILNGTDVLKSEPRGASLAYRADVQMIFQDPFASLNPVHTVGYHLERPLRIHGKARTAAERRGEVEALLTSVGLTPAAKYAEKFPHELSGGQRQRVAFARALAVEPGIMLADEPISMLDVSIRMGILNLMERLKEERGIAYLYITHDIASARYIADETIVMYAGRMIEGAPSVELVDHPAHP